MFSLQEFKNSGGPGLAGFTASVSQLKFKDMAQIASVLPQLQAVAQALYDVLQEATEPKGELQSSLQKFLQSTGFLAKETSTKSLLDKIGVLHTAIQALIKSIPKQIKPETVGQTAILVDDLFTKIQPIIEPISELTTLYYRNQKLNTLTDANNLVKALSERDSVLNFFGWYHGLASVTSTTLLVGKVNLIGRAIPHLLTIYQQKDAMVSLAEQGVALCRSGESWDQRFPP